MKTGELDGIVLSARLHIFDRAQEARAATSQPAGKLCNRFSMLATTLLIDMNIIFVAYCAPVAQDSRQRCSALLLRVHRTHTLHKCMYI